MKNCACGAGRHGAKNAIGQLAADVPNARVGTDDKERRSQFGVTATGAAFTVTTSFANGYRLSNIVPVDSGSVGTEMQLGNLPRMCRMLG